MVGLCLETTVKRFGDVQIEPRAQKPTWYCLCGRLSKWAGVWLLARGQLLTCRKEADNSAHLHKWSEKHHVSANSHFHLHRALKYFITIVFENNTATCFVYSLRRHVCSRALIGWAHLSVKRWREVSYSGGGISWTAKVKVPSAETTELSKFLSVKRVRIHSFCMLLLLLGNLSF